MIHVINRSLNFIFSEVVASDSLSPLQSGHRNLQGYKQIYSKRFQEVQNQSDRMKVGLDKLNEAEASVKELSKELVVKEKELEVANVKAQGILEEVTDLLRALAGW